MTSEIERPALEETLRIEQRILISKNNTLLRMVDAHNERLALIRRELVKLTKEPREVEPEPVGEGERG